MFEVWSAAQRVSRVRVWKDAAAALVFHYQRMVLGPQYGMKEVAA